LVQREIIANASSLVRISPRTDGKGTKTFGNSHIKKGKSANNQKKMAQLIVCCTLNMIAREVNYERT